LVIVTIPDDYYLSHPPTDDFFYGRILVEDWYGHQLRNFNYHFDGTYEPFRITGQTNKEYMKKQISAVIFFIFIFHFGYSQLIYHQSDESDKIYISVLNQKLKDLILVNQRTDSNLLRQYDPRNYKSFLIDTNAHLAINNPKWENFISQIDTSKIINYTIADHFNNDHIILFNSHSKKRMDLKNKPYYRIQFSPVILSSSNELAIFSYIIYNRMESSQGIMCFLEKKGSTWRIVERITLFIAEYSIAK